MEPRTLLVDFLRDAQGLTGTKVGCETGQCGACAVLIDDRSVKSCTVLAVQTDGSAVTTIEGVNGEVGDTGLNPLQQALWEEHATQCGFCTPGSPPSTPARSPAGGKLQQPDSPVFNKQLTEAQAREVLAATTA